MLLQPEIVQTYNRPAVYHFLFGDCDVGHRTVCTNTSPCCISPTSTPPCVGHTYHTSKVFHYIPTHRLLSVPSSVRHAIPSPLYSNALFMYRPVNFYSCHFDILPASSFRTCFDSVLLSCLIASSHVSQSSSESPIIKFLFCQFTSSVFRSIYLFDSSPRCATRTSWPAAGGWTTVMGTGLNELGSLSMVVLLAVPLNLFQVHVYLSTNL